MLHTHRHGREVQPEGFRFDREGLSASANGGQMCEMYLEGRVSAFALQADDLRYQYNPPKHASFVHTGHDFYAMHDIRHVRYRVPDIMVPDAETLTAAADWIGEQVTDGQIRAGPPSTDGLPPLFTGHQQDHLARIAQPSGGQGDPPMGRPRVRGSESWAASTRAEPANTPRMVVRKRRMKDC